MDAPFSPIKTDRLHERVARQLREAILGGRYKAGDRLPVERELVELFGVSRSAVRQALLLLQQQGLLLVRQGAGGGVFVNSTQLDPVVDAFENLFALQEPLAGEHFVQAKALLEPVLSAAAIGRATDADLAALRANLTLTEQAVADGAEITELALEFHRLVGAATHNKILELILEAFVRIATRLPSAIDDRMDPDRLLAEHREIYRILVSGAPEDMERVVTTHLKGMWGSESAAG